MGEIMSERSFYSRKTQHTHDTDYDASNQSEGMEEYERAEKNPKSGQSADHVQRIAGLSIGISSVFIEQLLTHPMIVLRRQCQVNHASSWYHLTPVTLFQVMVNLQRHQADLTLWKGIGSTFMTKGIFLASETLISEITPFPKEVSRHSSMKKIWEHLCLKSLATIITTPFYAASLIETVQSDIASERPGLIDCVKEGLTRVVGMGMPQTARLLPIWRLLLPTISFRLSHYVISSLAQYTILSTTRLEQQENGVDEHSVDGQTHTRSIYDIYFPELIATFTGNLLADIMLYPCETVLNRLYLQGTRTIIDNTDSGMGVIPINTKYEGLMDCYKSILMEEGVTGFYKGFGALVLQYAIHAIIIRLAKYLFERISQEFLQSKRATPNKPRKYRP